MSKSRRFRTAYCPSVNKPLDCGESMTHQSFKDECDINKMMARYQKTGLLPDLNKGNPRYGDFINVQSYQDSLHLVMHAQDQFDSLSSRVRARFNNDPSEFLDFATNPDNLDEMIELGLATKPSAEAPSKAPEPPSSAKADVSPTGEKTSAEQA